MCFKLDKFTLSARSLNLLYYVFETINEEKSINTLTYVQVVSALTVSPAVSIACVFPL